MKRRLALIIIFTTLGLLSNRICLANSIGPLGIYPNFTHLMADGKESVGEVLAIAQDKKGFLWFGGRTGLARYDGYRFHIYTNNPEDPNSIGSNYIHDIFEDSYGELWIATEGGGMARLNRELDNFYIYRYDVKPNEPVPSGTFEKTYEDNDKNLWFVGAEGVAFYDRKNDRFVRYLHDLPFRSEISLDMLQLNAYEYLFATANGIFLWNRNNNALEHFLPDASNPNSLPNRTVKVIFQDSNKNIWVGDESGLSRFIPSTKTFEKIPIKNTVKEISGVSIWKIFEDKNKMLWLSTDGNGLMYFNPATGLLGNYSKTASPTSLSSAVARYAFEDKAGDFWIGSFPIGANHYDRSNGYFSLYNNFVKGKDDIFKNQVWAFAEDKVGNLWLGIDSLGLAYFDRKNNRFSKNYDGFNFSDKGFPNTVLSLLEDSRGNLWCGTWAQGVSRFNLKTKSYTHFNPRAEKGSRFIGDSVWAIIEDSHSDIIFATMNDGFIRYNYATDTFTNFRHINDSNNSMNNNNAWSLFEEKDGRLWVGSSRGINIYDPSTQKFIAYQNDPNNPKSLSQNTVQVIFQDSKNRIWIGTLAGGLNLWHPETQSFTHLRATDGLSNDNVKSITEDNQGVLWIGTSVGITAYNPEKQTLQNYTHKNWLQEGEFSQRSAIKLHSGELAFGGANGFNIFNPQEVTKNEYIGPIYFTELEVFNQPVRPALENSPLKKDILDADKITLSHRESFFSMAFTSINYRVYDDNKYRYKLEGLDSDWHPASSKNKITYTHLDAGTYQLKVKASNNNDLWSSEEKSIKLVVLPAPWATWWAYTIYFLLGISCISWYVIAQKNKIAHEKKLNNKLVELDKLKDDFLANTSHELRTPINGIIGLAEALRDGSAGPQPTAAINNLGMIVSCGRRLERLINDILDFSKSKQSQFTLDYSCVDVYALIEEVTNECKPTVINDAVKIENNLPENIAAIYADEYRTKHIFYNLMANAIKFTEFGSITITATETEDQVKISITDTGIGIAQEHLEHIYTSFKQLAESGAHTKSGTGLGLSITKYFVDVQSGNLTVESVLGSGSVFTVSLPKANAQQLADRKTSPLKTQIESVLPSDGNSNALRNTANETRTALETMTEEQDILPCFLPKENETQQEGSRTKILVVDDEAVNRMVLRHMLLKHDFIVYEACNGKEVVDAMHKGFKCDLVLLDIMMPKMSGTEACKEIRTRYAFHELPIIFVTAKTQVSDLVECFEVGGNDFLSKPVNREELYARTDAHLKLLTMHRTLEKRVHEKTQDLDRAKRKLAELNSKT
jgi:two-component system, sensor histidine kinase ChiS